MFVGLSIFDIIVDKSGARPVWYPVDVRIADSNPFNANNVAAAEEVDGEDNDGDSNSVGFLPRSAKA